MCVRVFECFCAGVYESVRVRACMVNVLHVYVLCVLGRVCIYEIFVWCVSVSGVRVMRCKCDSMFLCVCECASMCALCSHARPFCLQVRMFMCLGVLCM